MRRSIPSRNASRLLPRIVPVDPEVEGEVVARAGRDADEGKIVLDGDGGHQRLRAVTARHGQAVGPTSDGVAGQLLEVEPAIEHDHLDAHALGEFDQPELRHLAAPRPGIADEDRAPRSSDRQRSASVAFVKVAGDGRSTGADSAHDERRSDGESEHWAISVGLGPDHGDDDQHRAEHRAGDPEGPARCPLGDDPPGAADRQGDTDQPDDQEAQVANREHHHRHGEQHPTPERCRRKGALAPPHRVCSAIHASSQAGTAHPVQGSMVPGTPCTGQETPCPNLRTCPGRVGTDTRAPDSRPGLDGPEA